MRKRDMNLISSQVHTRHSRGRTSISSVKRKNKGFPSSQARVRRATYMPCLLHPTMPCAGPPSHIIALMWYHFGFFVFSFFLSLLSQGSLLFNTYHSTTARCRYHLSVLSFRLPPKIDQIRLADSTRNASLSVCPVLSLSFSLSLLYSSRHVCCLRFPPTKFTPHPFHPNLPLLLDPIRSATPPFPFPFPGDEERDACMQMPLNACVVM